MMDKNKRIKGSTMDTITDCAAFSRYKTVRLCFFQGQKVVLKVCEDEKAFKHEKRMYDVLQLGGSVRGIARRIASYDQTLVVEYIAAKDLPTDLSMKVKVTELLLKTVQRMHEKGVVHKDLRFGDNVIFDGERFVIIDFDAACLQGTRCNNKRGTAYQSEMIEQAGFKLDWDHWRFLDYLYLCDELSLFLEGHIIGKRFRNMLINVLNKVEKGGEEPTTLLNAQVLLNVLQTDSELTQEPMKRIFRPFPPPPVINNIVDNKFLFNLLQSYIELWNEFYEKNMFVAPPATTSVAELKERIRLLSDELAMEVYALETDEGDFLRRWPGGSNNRVIESYLNGEKA